MKLVLLPKKTRGGTVVAHRQPALRRRESAVGQVRRGELAGALLMRGTKDKNRQQIQDEADKLKARINLGGSATASNISIERWKRVWPGP